MPYKTTREQSKSPPGGKAQPGGGTGFYYFEASHPTDRNTKFRLKIKPSLESARAFTRSIAIEAGQSDGSGGYHRYSYSDALVLYYKAIYESDDARYHHFDPLEDRAFYPNTLELSSESQLLNLLSDSQGNILKVGREEISIGDVFRNILNENRGELALIILGNHANIDFENNRSYDNRRDERRNVSNEMSQLDFTRERATVIQQEYFSGLPNVYPFSAGEKSDEYDFSQTELGENVIGISLIFQVCRFDYTMARGGAGIRPCR